MVIISIWRRVIVSCRISWRNCRRRGRKSQWW